MLSNLYDQNALGADVDAVDHLGRNVFYNFTQGNFIDIDQLRRKKELTSLLLCAGADLNIRDSNGKTILHGVMDELLRKYLISLGAIY